MEAVDAFQGNMLNTFVPLDLRICTPWTYAHQNPRKHTFLTAKYSAFDLLTANILADKYTRLCSREPNSTLQHRMEQWSVASYRFLGSVPHVRKWKVCSSVEVTYFV